MSYNFNKERKEASGFTKKANAEFYNELDFNDIQDFKDIDEERGQKILLKMKTEKLFETLKGLITLMIRM